MSFPETSPEMLLQYIMDSCAKLGATDVDLRYSRSTSESVSAVSYTHLTLPTIYSV